MCYFVILGQRSAEKCAKPKTWPCDQVSSATAGKYFLLIFFDIQKPISSDMKKCALQKNIYI